MSCYKIDTQKAQKTNKNLIKKLSKKALQEKLESKGTAPKHKDSIRRELQLRTK